MDYSLDLYTYRVSCMTPSTSPTALTPPRLPSPSSPLTLQPQSFDTVMQENIIPATNGTHSPPCSPPGEPTVPDGAASPGEEGRRPSGSAGGEVEAVQEMTLTVLRLLEQHGASLGLCSGPAGAVGRDKERLFPTFSKLFFITLWLLKSLLAEREKMVAEIQSLKETLKCSSICRRLHHAGLHAHRPLPRLSLTPRHRHQRLQWCRTRLPWSDSEWQRVIFSDESRFSLGGDAQRIRVWRHRGQHRDERFVVTRPEGLVSLHLHPYRTICRNCVRMFKLHGMDYHRTPLGTSTAPYRDVWRVGLANTAARRHTERQTSTERAEWEQFQSDLRVAVSVADRLRLEAEEATRSLQDTYAEAERRLAETVNEQSLREKELESVRAQLTEAQHTLHTLTLEHQHTLAELDTLRQRSRVRLQGDQQTMERSQTVAHTEKRNQSTLTEPRREWRKERLEPKTAECASTMKDPQKAGEAGESEKRQDTEDRKREEGSPGREPRRIIMLSERSRSLSQIPLPAHSSSVLPGSFQNLTCTASPIKSQETPKETRVDSLLQRQDSWSRSIRGKREGDPTSEAPSPSSSKIRPQDGFSLLLRRHGGSRRNSLLRWCQCRTQGYKRQQLTPPPSLQQNIEITNFSSSWEDGLAFCAVYHSYLPTHIPYSSLKAEAKRRNLDLAFHTGESVGVKATLTVEEMLREEGPDWQKVLGYVESMYRHFEM
ncbi:hypothetical protein NFI96_000260 [Prochilodus magdalenae]|nr:hypothetical protein NFI96_000260 [Prochilodus magdalenae]